MLQSTRGIVLQTHKYTDNSVIAKIFTSAFGLKSYLVSGIYNKKSATRSNLLQPLSMLELIVTHNDNNKLQRIKELSSYYQYITIPIDTLKTSIILFLNEMLCLSIKETEKT